jgi:Protein of unknown function (DUF2971)
LLRCSSAGRAEIEKRVKVWDMDVWDNHELVFHYTSQEGLQGILQTQVLHVTHYKFLNDKQEILQLLPRIKERVAPHLQIAITRLVQYDRRVNAIVEKHGGLKKLAAHEADAVISALYKATFRMRNHQNFYEPFIISFCAHADEYEKKNGLLSQWRAYSGKSGYAIAFDCKSLHDFVKLDVDSFACNGVHFSDVVYDGDENKFEEEFSDLLDVLSNTLPKLFNQEYPDLNPIFAPFITAATRFKHRGFSEEHEVRFVVPPISADWMKRLENEQPEDHKKLAGKKVKKIQYRSDMTPFIRVGEDGIADLPIKYIIVGPDANKDSRREKLEKYLELSGRNIEVMLSDTPLV